MTATELLHQLESDGFMLTREDGQIRVRGSAALPPSHRDAIRALKPELLELLDAPALPEEISEATPCPKCGDTETFPTDIGPWCKTCFIEAIPTLSYNRKD